MLIYRTSVIGKVCLNKVQIKRSFAQATRKPESVEKEWWKENDRLKENRGKDQINVVFLEGIRLISSSMII
jgi:hypothetical protein